MAAGDAVQVGATVEIGLGGINVVTVDGSSVSGVWLTVTSLEGPALGATKTEIKDADQGATRTIIYTDPKKEIRITGIIRNEDVSTDELTVIEQAKVGDEIVFSTAGTKASRTNEAFLLMEPPAIRRQAEGVEVSFACERHDSLAATLGTS